MDILENQTVLLSVCTKIMRNTESGGDGLTKTEVEECSKVQQSQNTWLIINGFISVHSDQSAGSCFPLSTLITKPARHYPETSQFPSFTFFFFFKFCFLRASGFFCVCVFFAPCTYLITILLFIFTLSHVSQVLFNPKKKKKKVTDYFLFFISASFLSELCQFNIQREKAQLQTKGNFPPVHICLRGRRALTPGSNKRPTLGEKIR